MCGDSSKPVLVPIEKLSDDINYPNRWYLGDISQVDNWELTTSTPKEHADHLTVDEVNSEFQKFEENDPVRPDESGEYRAFTKLRLDPNKIVDIDLFRLKGFEVAVVISERIKGKIESIGTTGLSLIPVV